MELSDKSKKNIKCSTYFRKNAKDIENHLRECEKCQKELLIWDNITSAIRAIPMIEPSSSFVDNIVNSLPNAKLSVSWHSHIILWFGQFCIGVLLFALCCVFRNEVSQSIHFWGTHFSNALFGAILSLQLWKTAFWIAVCFVVTIACLQITIILELPNSKKPI